MDLPSLSFMNTGARIKLMRHVNVSRAALDAGSGRGASRIGGGSTVAAGRRAYEPSRALVATAGAAAARTGRQTRSLCVPPCSKHPPAPTPPQFGPKVEVVKSSGLVREQPAFDLGLGLAFELDTAELQPQVQYQLTGSRDEPVACAPLVHDPCLLAFEDQTSSVRLVASLLHHASVAFAILPSAGPPQVSGLGVPQGAALPVDQDPEAAARARKHVGGAAQVRQAAACWYTECQRRCRTSLVLRRRPAAVGWQPSARQLPPSRLTPPPPLHVQLRVPPGGDRHLLSPPSAPHAEVRRP